MNLIIKTRGNQPINDRDKKWAEAKFAKLAKLCPAETLVEVTLEDLYGPKGGRDKRVHVRAELAGTHEPFHLEETDLKFRQAITTARHRFERYVKRYREKQENRHRLPKNVWLANLLGRFGRRQETTDES